MSAGSGFVHLHCHTHYSLLDGANRIGDLVQTAKAMGMPAIAITDHGNLFGVIDFYQTALKTGIKPVLGMEAYIAPGHRRERDAKGIGEASYHLLLLAQNRRGYQNLLKLSSIAYREGFYYRPRIDREVLEAHHQGLICTSTCLGAEIPQALLKRDRAAAMEIAEWYLKVFGADRFFIELQDHGLPEQQQINPELIDIARRLGIGIVATNDVHYLTKDDAEAHDVLCCISTGKLVSDENRLKFPSDEYYLKSPEEMRVRFASTPEAIDNALAIANRCNVDLDFSTRHTPVYRPPGGQSPDRYLRELVMKGARERYGEISAEIAERIDYELEVIQSKGFASYFLIVWDFVHYARNRGIPCGARGSGCSAVVSYCLYLSQPDPMRYGLYFERFMDPDRDEMPDIDIDICQDGREEVLRYVREKYGHVAQIITFGTLKARAVLRDVSRVLGVPLAKADQVAKLVPEQLKMTLERALAVEPELRRLHEDDAEVRKVIDISRRLEGLARHAGVHAAGVVVADRPLDDLLPLYKPSDSDQVITQFEGTTVEKIGLLKMDFLGLRTLSVLERSRQLVERNHGVSVDFERLDLSDPHVYGLFARGDTKGIFQFESGGMRDVVMKMRPNRIEDLIAANALYRPGPMVNIEAYISRKHGEKWKTPHAIMSEVLEETYGIIVYQEQVARLAIRLGGIERKRAFRLAKAISKKRTEMIEAEREPFIAGAVKNGLDARIGEEIFNQILPFGEYAFNKAHSTGYALIAFQTAYMKAYYPIEFMAALLTFEMGDTDKIVEYIEECGRMGIDVRPPDVNSSEIDFSVVRSAGGGAKDGFIRFGLAAIKGVGERAVESILRARQERGSFENLYDFCERVDLTLVNRSVIEALIKAGAFDSTGAVRRGLMAALDAALKVGSTVQEDRRQGQLNMFGTFEHDAQAPPPPIPTLEWSEAEMLANEKAVLGLYVTRHPLTQHATTIQRFATADCADIATISDGTEIVLGGMISRVRYSVTRQGRNAGSKLAVMIFEDLTGSVEAVLYAEGLEQYRALIVPDRPLYLRGRVDRRREEPSLRVTEVIAFDDGPGRLSSGVILRLSTLRLEDGTIARLRDVCRAHRGDRPVFIEVETPQGLTATIRCADSMSVSPGEAFVRDAAALVGDGNVVVLGGRRVSRPVMLEAAMERTEVAVEPEPEVEVEEAVAL
ncbi:MAG: DNA polymerase III subunit alpha [Phycisphaerae bacterium]|nr:DNA polymerase III subunit alpha [Phycisphaerae bacterium]